MPNGQTKTFTPDAREGRAAMRTLPPSSFGRLGIVQKLVVRGRCGRFVPLTQICRASWYFGPWK
ncbi:MAG: hypothetical protein NVS3B10_03660 [Polyangiales bacterium]